MCNLYAQTAGQAALVRLAGVARDAAGNLPAQPAIFPDRMAPVVRHGADGVRELCLMRWGFPKLDRPGATFNTNCRHPDSPYWRPWLRAEQRCLVPVTSFCEYDQRHARRPTWFATGEDRAPFCFAGIWRPWQGTRGTRADPQDGEHRLFAFLTTDANAVVGAVHPKAMPVLLRTAAEREAWLAAPLAEALALQRPAADDTLRVVAAGGRADPGEAA